MARPGWGSLFGCFSSHHAAGANGRKSKKGGGGKKKNKKVTAAGSSSSRKLPRQGRSLQRLSFSDLSGGMVSPEDLSLSLVGSNLHIFTIAELRAVTRDFSMTNFIGEGGFGPVYKGYVDEKVKPGLRAQPVAVKLLDLEGTQGHNEWLTEVIFLGQLRHPHLVKLIGYCYEDEHRLLVYEFMTRGSLEKHLFKKYSASLPWSTRLKIAIGAARGLAFLHGAENPVIYRDFKTSNILLDSDYKAKLSDFGLAKDGPEEDETHVSTRVMGTQGYAAPEYIMTGHLTAKSDVYGFGVVLLELLTGRKSVDKSRPPREQNLVDWARSYLNDPRRLDRVMDPNLAGQYTSKAAQKAAVLAYQCVSLNPKARPHMSAVVDALEPLLALDDDDHLVGPFVYVAPPDNGDTGNGSRERDHRRRASRRSQIDYYDSLAEAYYLHGHNTEVDVALQGLHPGRPSPLDRAIGPSGPVATAVGCSTGGETRSRLADLHGRGVPRHRPSCVACDVPSAGRANWTAAGRQSARAPAPFATKRAQPGSARARAGAPPALSMSREGTRSFDPPPGGIGAKSCAPMTNTNHQEPASDRRLLSNDSELLELELDDGVGEHPGVLLGVLPSGQAACKTEQV